MPDNSYLGYYNRQETKYDKFDTLWDDIKGTNVHKRKLYVVQDILPELNESNKLIMRKK